MGVKRGYVVSSKLLLLLFAGVVFLAGFLVGEYETRRLAPATNENNFEQAMFAENLQEKPVGEQLVASDSGKIITHGPRDKKRIALTFDAEMTDGMKRAFLSGKTKSSYDERIVETLRTTKTPATFFLTGMWIELFPRETYDLAHEQLFELGSHSYTDSSYEGLCYGLNRVPDALAVEEIGATEKLLRKYAGIDNKMFRFPGGCYSAHAVTIVNEAGDMVVHWDVNGFDGFNNSADKIVQSVVNNVHNGSIVILQLNGPPTAPKTAEALPKIISKLKEKGYEFVTVTKLLGLAPNTRVAKE